MPLEAKLKAKFPGRDFYIGMDTALLIGEPSVLATGLLLIPMCCGAVYHSARQPRTALCRSGFLNVPAGNGHAVL